MVSPLYALLIGSAGVLALSLAAGWIHWLREMRDAQPPSPRAAPGVGDDEPTPPATPTERSLPDHETTGHWARTLLSPLGILGALALAIQPVVLWVNTYLLSRTFSVIFDYVPETLFTLTLWGVRRDVTLFDATALTISLGQMVLAAVAADGTTPAERSRGRSGIALAGWSVLAAFEVWASFHRSYLTGETYQVAAMGALLALGVVALEAVCGSLVFGRFLIPLSLTLSWSAGSLFRGIAWVVGRLAEATRKLTVPSRRKTKPKPAPALARKSFLHALDDLLQPLRDLDHVVYDRLLARVLPRSPGRTTMMALLVLVALGAQPAAAQIAAPAPQTVIDWYCAIDETRSVTPEEFGIYKNEMFPRLVLTHLRQRDRIYVFTIAKNPQERVEYLDLDQGRFTKAILTFYREKVQPLTSAPGRTDFGAVLFFITQSAMARQQEHAKSIPVAVLFTDGAPTGPQTRLEAPFPKEVKLYFFGVHAKNEPALRNFLRRANVPAAQVELAPRAGWEGWVAGFSEKIGRQPNTELLRTIRVARR